MTKPKTAAAVAAKFKVLLVDDHPLLREGIAQFLQREPNLTVCAQAGSVAEALEAISAHKPDIVVVDITLPGRDGLELIKDIRALHPRCLVIVLSMHEEKLYAERVLRAGARAYVMKHEPPQVLVDAIRRVLNGDIVVGKGMVDRVLHRLVGGSSNFTSPVDALSDRELEVFRLIGRGRQRQQIASELHLSVKTIEAHRANIRQKLGVRTAADLYQHAVEFFRSESADDQAAS